MRRCLQSLSIALALAVPCLGALAQTAAPVPATAADAKAGNGGVKFGPVRLLAGAPSGVNVGSPMVFGLPSPAPFPVWPVPASDSRMPVTGRQT